MNHAHSARLFKLASPLRKMNRIGEISANPDHRGRNHGDRSGDIRASGGRDPRGLHRFRSRSETARSSSPGEREEQAIVVA